MAVENRFWRSLDLMAQLIPFLDLASILALATVQPLVLNLLQRSFIWKNLIRRSASSENELEGMDREKIGELVEILKLVDDPEPHLMELLHTICERYPEGLELELEYPDEEGEEDEEEDQEEESTHFDLDSVQVSCSLHPAGHKVNTVGFELLESVEGAMGTTLQKVQQFEVDNFMENLINFPLASAFMARINRQNEPLKKVKINGVHLSANTGIFSNLLQNSKEWEIKEFTLEGDFGEEGWSWLAENLQKNKGPLQTIWASKVVMARAKREDLKAIWDQNQRCEWWLQWENTREEDIFVGGLTVEISNGKIVDPAWMEVQLILEKVKAQIMMEKVKSVFKQMEEGLVGALQELKEDQELDQDKSELDQKKQELDQEKQELDQKKQELDQDKLELDQKKQELDQKKQELDQEKQELDQEKQELDQKKQELDQEKQVLDQKKHELDQEKQEIDKKKQELEKYFFQKLTDQANECNEQ